jgi:hypothetical protein
MLIFLLPVVDPAGGFIQIGDGGFSAGCLQFLIFSRPCKSLKALQRQGVKRKFTHPDL